MSFYNTIHETGQTLLDFNVRGQITNDIVCEIFMDNPDKSFTPYQIGDELEKRGSKMLQSSIKRAITDLTSAGKLIKTSIRVLERYGKNNYKWQLNQTL